MRITDLYAKSLRLFILAFGFALCAGCAETIDSPPPFAAVPESPWIIEDSTTNETQNATTAELFAACASCHMADGSGRHDGTVPRLAGQHHQILIHKLQKLRDGKVDLPVMTPFARALTDHELPQLAHYISALPGLPKSLAASPVTEPDKSNHPYNTFCAACHGIQGEGNDALLAPKLCHQHARYLKRRMQEIEQNIRGDADIGMMSVLTTVNQQTRDDISQWLASGQCEPGKAVTENQHES